MTTMHPAQTGSTMAKEFRLYTFLAGLFVATLLVSAIASTKVAVIAGVFLPAGTLIFPITFALNDVLTETYGFARSRIIIWTGLVCQVYMSIVLLAADSLAPAPFWGDQEAFHTILGIVPRVALGGVAAYFLGEMANSVIISRMKYAANGRRGLAQGWRFVASTIVGEAVDSVVFMMIAFWGRIPTSDLLHTLLTLYVVKVGYEIVALPFSTRLSNWLKRVEGVDHIDTPATTSYSPFIRKA
jgi:uncharacterized integral membrane protein (TIGR00697 family)